MQDDTTRQDDAAFDDGNAATSGAPQGALSTLSPAGTQRGGPFVFDSVLRSRFVAVEDMLKAIKRAGGRGENVDFDMPFLQRVFENPEMEFLLQVQYTGEVVMKCAWNGSRFLRLTIN